MELRETELQRTVGLHTHLPHLLDQKDEGEMNKSEFKHILLEMKIKFSSLDHFSQEFDILLANYLKTLIKKEKCLS